jgi:adenosine deaminase
MTQIAPSTTSTADSDATLARSLPKVELHCHLEGAVRPVTVADLARTHGVPLPVDDPNDLFRFSNLAEFLDVFSLICSVLRTADDFRRITYEALVDAAAVGVRYREMFFSPGFLLGYGVALDTIWDGIRAGQDRDMLVGIGGDNTERGIDHRSFTPAFELAGRHGLRRTMHAGEDGPSDNIAIALDDLGCERIDHGVRLGDDPDLLARVAAERIPLTVCPISNVVLTGTVRSVAAHPLVHQRAAGVLVTLNSDDPGMSGTTIADDYEQVADAFGYDVTTMAQIALDGIEACWAPDDEKRALDGRFRAEIATLVPGWEAS